MEDKLLAASVPEEPVANDAAPEEPFLSTINHAAADPFRLLVEAVKDYGIFMLDAAGHVSSWNPGAEAIHGYTAKEIIGQPISVFYTPEDVADGQPQQGLATALAAGRLEEEGLRLRKNGEQFWAIVTITNVHDAFGQHIGYANVTRDITERKEAEDTLRKTEAELAEAIQVARMGYWSRNLASGVLTWSARMYEMFGLTPAEFGRTFDSLLAALHPDDQEPVRARIEQAVATGGAFDHTYRIIVQGEVRVIHEVGNVTAGENCQPMRISGTAQDVTERTRTGEALRASEERFRTLIAAISEIVWSTPASGNFEVEQPAWTAFTGQTFEQLRGQGWLEAIHPADRDGTTLAWTTAVAGQAAFQLEHRIRRADGEYRQMSVRAVPVRDPGGAVLEWVGVHTDVTDHKRAEEALHLRDRAIRAATQGLMITDPTQPENPLIYVSPGFEQITGYSSDEALGRNCRFLQGKDSDPAAIARMREAVQSEQPCAVELLNYRKDGSSYWNELSISPVRDTAGRLTHFVGVQADVTARRLLEQQFHQAQKMEAVGQLAGGVAHDFNNLLTVISGYSELLLGILPAKDPKREAVKAISEAGARAAGLTRQLLSFSRQAVLETKVLNLNEIVLETEKMLRRIIGEGILLTSVLDPRISRIKVDPGQMGQVLMNLVINARDAMHQGGKLTLETASVELDEAYAAQQTDCKPGRYVMLSVSDNGCGMTPEVRRHIFEPFFTTKGPGKGTGLGLATVYGIVKQSGGTIGLYSEPGLGSTFKIYLPAVDEPWQASDSAEMRIIKASGGTETLLLVEDEDAVRAIAMLALQTQGYRILSAEGGKQALRLADQHQGRIDLLVTDVVMPGMSGRELAETLLARDPLLKVLYLSGYTDDAVVRHGILAAEVAFLQKPYTPMSLARKVREVLDKQPDPASAPPRVSPTPSS